MSEVRIVATLAVVFSLATIFACLLVVPRIYYEVQEIWAEIDTEMTEFRALTNDIWSGMEVSGAKRVELRRAARAAYDSAQHPSPLPFSAPVPKEIIEPPLQQPATKKCKCNAKNNCPPGPKGVVGAPGRPGFPGQDGLHGENGKDASDVKTINQMYGRCFHCPAGKQGPQGPMGELGIKGKIGARGQDGRNGRNGRPGRPGPKGDMGEDGPPGRPGPLGDPGLNGSAGKGQPGFKGIPGDIGDLGQPGEPGNDGYNGEVGFVGPQGVEGFPGREGRQGPAGEVGVVGPPGRDAQYCPCPSRETSLDDEAQYSAPAPPNPRPPSSSSQDLPKDRVEIAKPPAAAVDPSAPSDTTPITTTRPVVRELEHPAVLVPIDVIPVQKPTVRRVSADYYTSSGRQPVWNRGLIGRKDLPARTFRNNYAQ